MPSLKLVWRNLSRRPLRSTLTIFSLALAIFLVCVLRTLITTIAAGVDNANPRRLAVLSSTGLFVEMPVKYQAGIEKVPGVEMTTKFQWFGGYFRSQQNFFAQFAVDPATLFEMYPECEVPVEQQAAFRRTRNGAIIGTTLARDFGWKIGDTVPIIGSLHPHPQDRAWEFEVCGIYHSDVPSFDNRTMFFRWDYFEETLKEAGETPGVGVFSLRARADADVARVISDVNDAFRDSEQRVDCVTEAEFQRQFQTMFGNIPVFLGWIGGGVLIAILVATINTMLMAMREQTTDIGIMKALGFTDGAVSMLFVVQAFFLAALGGGIGLFAAWASQSFIGSAFEQMFPSFVIQRSTFALALVIIVALGLFAGIVPAWRAGQLRTIDALRGGD